MNIAMILDEEFPPDPRVENEANCLIEAGHSVSLFCLSFTNRPSRENIKGIEVYRYSVPKYVYSLSALAYTIPVYRWILQKKLKLFFSQVNPDAVHVHDMRVAHAVKKVVNQPQVPTILDLHENRPEIMKHYEHVKEFPGNLLISPPKWKKWEKKLVQQYDHVVVVTSEAKQHLSENYKLPENKVTVFPNTVHPSFYTEYEVDESLIKRFQNKWVIFYLGDTGYRRGLETAIRALPELKNKIPSVLLVVAGKSRYDLQLKKLVHDLGLESYVSFEGYQQMKMIPSYILASKVCISPLHRNIHHDTTYANKIFQYMSLGLPVVVSDCTAQKNVVEEAGAGLVHQAEDVRDYEQKIIKLYDNPDSAQKMGELGKKFVKEKFNQNITSAGLVHLYNQLSKKN
jgi:glycosyltransferase involved in cell wall biosynthesis